MKNKHIFVSFEESERLKSIGFPQPKITPFLQGQQYWYTSKGKLVATAYGYLTSMWIIFLESPMEQSEMITDSHDLVFAPTIFEANQWSCDHGAIENSEQ